MFAISLVAVNGTAQAPTAVDKAAAAGSPATVTGVLTVMYADDFANRTAELSHLLRDERTGRTFRLRFEHGAPGGLRSGARVRARGRVHGSEIYLAAADGTGVTLQSLDAPQPQQTPAVTGTQNTLSSSRISAIPASIARSSRSTV